MATAFRKYIPALLLSAFVVTTACSDSEFLAGPTSSSGLQGPPGALVTVEPEVTRAEFLSHGICPAAPPFGVRIVVILSDRIVIARRVRFELAHRQGRPAVPLVVPLLTPATTARPVPSATPLPTPTQSPVPIPTAPGLPVPGAAPRIEDLLLSARRLPLFLEFGCGVPAEGRLIATIDTTDTAGRTHTSVVDVRVGQ